LLGNAGTYADIVVFLDDTPERAAARRRRLDDLDGAEFASPALVFAGTPVQLADLLAEWSAAGVTGFRLLPATLPHDLTQISSGLAPELQRRGLSNNRAGSTLRELLGLPRPANRYAQA
jgi:alkanesulfonate monooxygenase SsuD/methylene tetrahydromethanopterin reductase-like flavin-dependent oxidoreductase (luciferase family)